MRHCVAAYLSRCLSGQSTIWSLRRRVVHPEGASLPRSMLTIELDPRSATIVQVRGFANQRAGGQNGSGDRADMAQEPGSFHDILLVWLAVASSCGTQTRASLTHAASARSLNRWILPVAVLGSSSMNSTQRGYFHGASCDFTC